MPTNYTGRVATCIGCVLVALFIIFYPPGRLFNPNLTLIQKTNLNPGIDMVGGVRLIYEIQAPPGTQIDNLANNVMDALKRRVDPNGLRNLVWRPQGNTRLEIQMPLSPEAGQAPAIKKAFDDAKAQLEATNVRPEGVIKAAETLKGTERDQKLAELASDSATREQLFKSLAETFDEVQKLKANPDKLSMSAWAAKAGPLNEKYEKLKMQIDDTNLPSTLLQSILDQVNSDKDDQKKLGQGKLDDLKKKFADFPTRVKTIDDFAAKYAAYLPVSETITGEADLERLLQGSGVLEFHIMADRNTTTLADLQAMDTRLGPDGKGPLPQPGDTMQWMEVDKQDEFDKPGFPPETREWNGRHYVLVLVTSDASMTKASAEKWGLDHANAQADEHGARAVGFEFNSSGARLFGNLTDHWVTLVKNNSNGNAKARLAIVLDNKVISAPNLLDAITGGSGIITAGGGAGFDTGDAGYLINTLNAGSLPAQLSNAPISKEQVGPTLGADNLYRGLIACAFGMIVVGIFLVAYYYLAGLVAFVAVCMNVLLILGVMAGMGATFTLPAIAGIVLTVGTAVDANVLIFERLREEQHKGLSLRMALRNSYDQARSAIVDSNMTSIITSVCLYWFGSEEVRGFGLTLIIGILASLFTALYVTKTIFGILIDKFGVRNLGSFPLTFPKWDKALRPDWDWMGKAWIFYAFSVVAIGIGLVLFGLKVHEGKMMDIEFTSGTSVQFALTAPMQQEDVRQLIDDAGEKDPVSLPSPSVVAVGSDQLHYEVVTPNVDREAVKKAVLAAMKDKLKIQLPSNFDQVDADYPSASGTTVLPVTNATFSVDGFSPSAVSEHVGGVAIVLRNISPQLSVNQIQQRLNNERASSSSAEIAAVECTVTSQGDPTKPTDSVVIIGWNPSVSYSADEAKWAEELAKPLWGLVKDAVHRPPSFEKETNFDPQVAGEMQRDALLALFCSIAAIMVYIWVRFGNLKFATATVVALLHDTVFTLAAMGFAHYFADFWHHNPLQIEPFSINLPVVAGILTIMSYSMIDTIVVFDRIRENRGKFGHLDRTVINTAINQTLSRTLLTAGTSIITVSFMYFMGGAGIHGFTFVLLIGILVGTYSSVAIAAPMLLWGRGAEDESRPNRPPVGQLQRTAG